MSNQVCLVYFGEILPGFDPGQVRGNLTRLLGLTPAQVEGVFSGQRVVLKAALAETEASRYVDHMARLGARVRVEPLIAPVGSPPAAGGLGVPHAAAAAARPATPPAITPHAASPLPPIPAAPAEQTTCPACGETQPKRTLCRKCGVNMAGIQAAQRSAAEEAAMIQEAEAEIRARNGGRLENPDAGREVPNIFSFNFSGRMGRLTYLLVNFLVWPITLILLLIAFRDRNVALIIAALVLPALISLRASVLRCHDLNWTGWLVLISLIPYVGAVFSLILLLAPGTKEMNNYGDVPGATPGKRVLAGLAFLVAVAVFTVPQLIAEGMRMAGAPEQHAAGDADPDAHEAPAATAGGPRAAPGPAVADPAATVADSPRKSYDGSINTVLLYTVGECAPCTERRIALARLGLFPREVRVDLNEPAETEMIGKLVKAGQPVSSLQMPVIDVNGTILNNPPIEVIEKYLH